MAIVRYWPLPVNRGLKIAARVDTG